MKALFRRAFAWLRKWKTTFFLLLGLNSTRDPNINTVDQKELCLRNVPDLTVQINEESPRYPIAQGSFGDVWKCTSMQSRLEVAVKCLRIEIQDDGYKEEITKRLEHELQQSPQLKHEHLLPLLGTTQQTADTLVVPRRQSSVDDVLCIGSSSSPSHLLPGMPAHTDTHRNPPPKPRRLSKMPRRCASLVEVSTFSSPELIPQSNSNDPTDRMEALPDLTGQVSRTSEHATSCGGLSDIWRCILKWNGLVVVVAVKSIRNQGEEEEEIKEKDEGLRHELKIWSRLRHDNIVPLYGTVSGFGPFVALVCPWYEKGSLLSYLESVGETLTIVDRFQRLSDISAGLQYLHSCSIAHGDLTSSNVLISSDGRAHLADFGLSVTVAESITGSYYAPAFSGTMRWIAPELVAVPEEEDTVAVPTTQSDIYSFGCIMLQVLTGKLPFSQYKRDAQVVVAISLGEKPLRPELPAIADHHWAFIMNCWSIKDCRPSAQQVDAYIKEQLHFFQRDSISPD